MKHLVMDQVSYKYLKSQRLILKQVSCSFNSGKIYAIMGPSGSGKSTVLSLLAGLDNPTEGHIRLNHQSLREMNLDDYRQEKIAMIFQSFHLLPLLTVVENVCYPMTLKGISFKEAAGDAKKILAAVGITNEKLNRFPSKLSGGEQQRVAIARSIASGATIILADEPTGNLDQENTDVVLKILKNLSIDKGYTIIVVSHDEAVAKIADIVYEMKAGKLICK